MNRTGIGRRPSVGSLVAAGLLLLPLLEFVVTVRIARSLGGALTLLLIVASMVAGVMVLRSVGLQALRRISGLDPASAAGPAGGGGAAAGGPVEALVDAALRTLAGLLLVVPGLLSGALGLILLVPAVRRLLHRRFESRLRAAVVRVSHTGTVVMGEVVMGEVITDQGARPGAAVGEPGPLIDLGTAGSAHEKAGSAHEKTEEPPTAGDRRPGG